MKTLLKDQIPEWSRNYISYKPLKKLTKPQDGVTIDDIETSLNHQLEKVNNFFQNKYTETKRLIKLISERYDVLLTQNDSSIDDTNTPNFDQYADEDLLSILSDLLEIRDRAHDLFHFSNINKQGFARILKKLGRESKEFSKFHTLQFTSDILFAEIFDSIEEIRHRVLDHEWSVPRKIEFATKDQFRANLSEQNILTNSICNDNVEDLKKIIPNLDNKKTLTRCLYKAVHFRAMKCVKLLLGSGANIIIDDDINERSLIHKLVIHGGELPRDKSSLLTAPSASSSGDRSTLFEDISLISCILENIPQTLYTTISTKDSFGKRPLHYASLYGFSKITKLLLEFLIRTEQLPLRGFNDPSWFDNDGFTPLLYAASRGHAAVLNCFVNAGISVIDLCPSPTSINEQITSTAYVSSNSLALHHACKFGHNTIVEILLVCGVDPDIQNEEGETALHISARNGFHDCVKLLVDVERKSNLKKANLEIMENYYGRTPLFLAAIEGHTECVNVLLRAGANPNVMDNSGWTPCIHAVFRGHSVVTNILYPLTTIEELSPPSTSKLNVNEFTYGRKYLQDQSLVFVMLGSTSDVRKDVNPVELYDTSSIPLTSVSIVVSAKNATGGTIISLPINTLLEPICFYSSNIDEAILTFDIIPTYGSKERPIGRGISPLKTSSDPQNNLLTVPILDTNTLEIIGRTVFELLIIKPFKHENLSVGGKRTHWKSVTTKVIGHRGFGMNRLPHKLEIGENTLLSFITAASKGVEYVEFDVQLTRDHVPVIYHDWIVSETGYDIPVHHITLQQFQELKNRKTETNRQLENLLDREFQSSFSSSDTNQRENKRLKRSNSIGSVNTLTYPEKEEEKELKGNGDGTIQAPFATLAEAFKKLPNIGFNIEVKYPMVDEAEDLPFHVEFLELNLFVDKILEVVYNCAQDRNIIFSSFHPDIILLLAYKQPDYPIFFLSDCGKTEMADARCNSLKEAIRFAKFADLLSGIVSASAPIIKAPKLVKTVKEAGLLLFTYGNSNNNLLNVKAQRTAGVDAVIVDSVMAIKKGLQQ